MVSQKKILELKDIIENSKQYPVIGIVDLSKIPSKQLQAIRKDVRDNVIIKMYKKKLIEMAFKEINKEGLMQLYNYNPKKPALIFSKLNPFKLYKLFEKSKTPTFAKEGDVTPYDIIIREGPTKLPAGPAIGELQRAKIPAMVKEGKIYVSKDTVVAKKGSIISAELATLLKKLEIQPMEIGVNLLGVWENGTIFDANILLIKEDEYRQEIQIAYQYGLNLAVNIAYPTKDSIKLLLQKAFRNAKNVGIEAEILDKIIIEDLIKKAEVSAKMLQSRIGV